MRARALKAMGSVLRSSIRLIIAAIVIASSAHAQSKKSVPAPSPQPQQAQPQTVVPGGIPDQFKLNLLIRSSIIALNQANRTGNYTVLQDLAAPAFRASNDSAHLAQIFANLRQRNLDLTPILFFTPKLVAPPTINAQGILRMAGFFPTAPERVNFELYFQMIGGEWRLYGIGVTTSPAEVTAAIQPQSQGAAQAISGDGIIASVKPGGAEPAGQKLETSPSNSVSQAEPMPSPLRKPSQAVDPGEETTAETQSTVRNGATTNAIRIDLSNTNALPQGSEGAGKSDGKPSFWDGLNIFSRN